MNFCGTNYVLSSKTTEPLFFKVIQYDYKTFENVKPAPEYHIAKNIKLGAKFATSLWQGSKHVLYNLFWYKYCFSYKQLQNDRASY